MTEREYQANCANGHRTYVRLRMVEAPEDGICPRCSEPAMLVELTAPHHGFECRAEMADDGGHGEGSYYQRAMGKDD